jgi:hypothetical protein
MSKKVVKIHKIHMSMGGNDFSEIGRRSRSHIEEIITI